MNRAVLPDPGLLETAPLPPPRREGPARVLFLSARQLGLATYADQLIEATAAHPGIDAVHVGLRAPAWMRVLGKSLRVERGWDLHAWRHARMWRWRLARPLQAVLPRFDVVHVLTQRNAAGVIGPARRAGVRTCINTDATAALEVSAFGYAPLPHRLIERADAAVLQGADLVSCWSNWAAESVVRDCNVPPGRVIVSPPGVRVAPNPTGPRPAGPPRIVFVGEDWRRKGGPRLLEWHRERWAAMAELHVVTRSPRPRGPMPGVVWHGPVPRTRLRSELLPLMDLMVLPTREDTLAIAVLEAAAAALPVVASRLAGLCEAVVDGATGVLCAPSDDGAFVRAVENMLSDAGRLRTMGAAARAHVLEKYNPDITVGGLLERLVALAAAPARVAWPVPRPGPAEPAAAGCAGGSTV